MNIKHFFLLLLVFPVCSYSQDTKVELEAGIYAYRNGGPNLVIPVQMDCDSVYDVLSKFQTYNPKINKELYSITFVLRQFKENYYQYLSKNAICPEVRDRIVKEFIEALKSDSTGDYVFEYVFDFFFTEITKEDIEKYEIEALMRDMMKRDRIYNSNYFSRRIISTFRLKEYLPKYWEIFYALKANEESNGFRTHVMLSGISEVLGDSLNAHKQYIDDMWQAAKSDSKRIESQYPYLLISRIEDVNTTFRQEKVETLFEILEFLVKCPEKDKEIFWKNDSDYGELFFKYSKSIFFEIGENVVLPTTLQTSFAKISQKEINELLKWYKKNPKFKLKQMR
jgi:hypothetical protein